MRDTRRNAFGVMTPALAILVLVLSFSPVLAEDFVPPGQLERVVILSRHGVRSPTKDTNAKCEIPPTPLSCFRKPTTPPWPDFGVQHPADLTLRGAFLMQQMGASYRKGTWADLFRTSFPGECPEAFFWADRDERTLMTARSLVGGLVGGPNTPWAACNLPVRQTTEATDPVFHPTSAIPACKIDPQPTNPTVSPEQIQQVQDVVDCCSEKLCTMIGKKPPICQLKDVMDDTNDKKIHDQAYDFIPSFGEILLFEYAQGFEGNNFAFGNPQYPPTKNGKWMELLAVHADLFNKQQRNPSVALPQGANLLYHMAYAIKYGAPLIPPSTKGPPSKVVVYVGHDTNIANVAELLGLNWKIGDYPPNDVAPGAALAFEVRLDSNLVEYVYAVMLAQPPESLRGDGSDVSSRRLRIRECSPDCAMRDFVTIVKDAIKYDENKACITDWRDLAD